ncbi:response regulator transcription factor [Streptomyces sp. NPDC019531]|uniref:response regulator transcription factor n=1 Tax=Streptomyces sp. NPDC019531 TaxID=3365062 RepID=UPI00384C53CB
MRPHLALIEDEPDFALMCRSSLERAGFTVTWVMDARAGKSVFHESRVDLAVLDLGLPDGSGLELLRALGSTSRLPVIVVTGRGTEADRVAGLEIGADGYLVKPFAVAGFSQGTDPALSRAAGFDAQLTKPLTELMDFLEGSGGE